MKCALLFSEKMQSDSSLNQFNNDELFSDEPCSSCRLTINKETGRLKCVSNFLHCLFLTHF